MRWKRIIYILVFLLIFTFSTIINISADDEEEFPYPGLSLTVSKDGYTKLQKLWNFSSIYEALGYSMISEADIITALENNFSKMVAAVNQNRSSLPQCLQDAFDRFLNEVKTPGNDGKPKANIIWNLSKDSQGDPKKYNDDYQDIYFQDKPDGKINGLDKKSNFDAKVPKDKYKGYNKGTGTQEWVKNTEDICIDGAFKDQCQANVDLNGQTYSKMISTPAIMFHESVHLFKQRYPDLFEQFNELEQVWREELTTEALTEKVFGSEKTPQFYRDYKYKGLVDRIDFDDLCNEICKDKSKCPKEKPKPPRDDNDSEQNSSGGSSSGDFSFMDHTDDNYSYSEGIVEDFNLTPESVIFAKGTWREAVKLLGGLTFDGDGTAQKLFDVTPVFIIPSGGLASVQYDSTFKILLEQYVNLGGTIIVLAQQYNTHFENLVPVPEGETLKAYGWRQDQSCYNGAMYFDTLHPVVCSSTSGLVTAANDGYFDAWPSTATVLLNRTKNREGALLYYPYGENGGHVILTSLYTDWGYAHSQATSAEIKIIRDLITFAKNPNLPIPMHNLEENANPDITLDVVVKNNTDSPAGKVKVIVSDPNREIVLYESEETCINYCTA